MKKYLKLVWLPRWFRIWFGKVFIKMLGRTGTHEFKDDFILYAELDRWISHNGKPTTPFL